jgi:Flp pilus assembly pilin Flp
MSWNRFRFSEGGTTSIEYTLIASVVAVVLIVGLTELGKSLERAFETAATDLSTDVTYGSSTSGSSSSGTTSSGSSLRIVNLGRDDEHVRRGDGFERHNLLDVEQRNDIGRNNHLDLWRDDELDIQRHDNIDIERHDHLDLQRDDELDIERRGLVLKLEQQRLVWRILHLKQQQLVGHGPLRQEEMLGAGRPLRMANADPNCDILNQKTCSSQPRDRFQPHERCQGSKLRSRAMRRHSHPGPQRRRHSGAVNQRRNSSTQGMMK